MSSSLLYFLVALAIVAAVSGMPSSEPSSSDIFLGSVPTRGAAGKAKFLHLVPRVMTWPEAWFYCAEAYNGVLVAIETPDDDTFVKNTMILNGINSAWTSGIYEGGWRWGEGGFMTYTNFASGYPGSTSYVVYVFSSGLSTYDWRTTSKTAALSSICQSVAL